MAFLGFPTSQTVTTERRALRSVLATQPRPRQGGARCSQVGARRHARASGKGQPGLGIAKDGDACPGRCEANNGSMPPMPSTRAVHNAVACCSLPSPASRTASRAASTSRALNETAFSSLAEAPRCSPHGVTITIACARIRRSPTGHRRSSATTTWPLPRRPAMGKTLTLDSPFEWRKKGSQVSGCVESGRKTSHTSGAFCHRVEIAHARVHHSGQATDIVRFAIGSKRRHSPWPATLGLGATLGSCFGEGAG